jgi:hypothetical protein
LLEFERNSLSPRLNGALSLTFADRFKEELPSQQIFKMVAPANQGLYDTKEKLQKKALKAYKHTP